MNKQSGTVVPPIKNSYHINILEHFSKYLGLYLMLIPSGPQGLQWGKNKIHVNLLYSEMWFSSPLLLPCFN